MYLAFDVPSQLILFDENGTIYRLTHLRCCSKFAQKSVLLSAISVNGENAHKANSGI